ncbi:MAG: efflux RND transporter periplasmic adaptor subunit [Defluviitaleaceae bacterium]|nr:efflux RND transporter periplasmic adaptor subunit [Defluviitaleaceae bacterium]MCL2263676.1 efflux RND transporter periplasmic adaptor subunit [Defluviitaleaceae bacterium]
MTNSVAAIFNKQFKDIMKNSDVLSQFIIYPVMAFVMTNLIDMNMPGMPDSYFIVMFAGMFVGMAFIGAVAIAIAEDIESNALRFLLMAGVKSHEYLLGLGGVYFVFIAIGSAAFSAMMPNASTTEMFLMFLSMAMSGIASIIIGAIIGMTSKNQQEAIGRGTFAGMIISFGPFTATMSQNDTLLRVFRFFYTMNFVDEDTSTMEAVESFGIIWANILLFALIFAFVYGKRENKGGNTVSKKAIMYIVIAAVVGYAGVTGFRWHNAGFIATDNAHVATTTVPIPATGSGVLERFSLQEGQHVTAGEVLGWVEGADAMRSPVDGLVIQTHAVQGQRVSPMETVAVISDASNVHIQANIEEGDILNVYVGQKVYVRIDTFGRHQFEGRVAGIGATALPPRGFATRATLLIPVEIHLTDDVDLARLIGVNASVHIPLR